VKTYEHKLRAPFFARGGHAQTIFGHVLPSPGRQIGEAAGDRRVEVEVSGGDRLVGFACSAKRATTDVRVHLFHGLSGDVNAEYMRRTRASMEAAGFEVWAFNHRGAGAGAGLASGIYHSGRSDDIAAVLAASRADKPDQLQLVIGFSLSGNASLKLAAELGSAKGPDGILAVNPPADLQGTSRRIHTGLNRLYERRFVRRLRASLQGRPHAPAIPRGASLWDVDELVTAPLGGFSGARDYYARCSTIGLLEKIERPTVILTAADDPFVEARALAAAPRSSLVHLHMEDVGGHVGYLEAQGLFGSGRWLDGALVHYAHQLERCVRKGSAAPPPSSHGT